jgi:hypothetical protein
MRNLELEKTLYTYIKENETEHIDFVNIINAFPKYSYITLMQSLVDLRIHHKIERIQLFGGYHKYMALC